MKQFDVYANPFPRSREFQPLLVILQSDLLLRNLHTVTVAPLELASAGKFVGRLNPQVTIGDKAYVIITQEVVTVRKSVLGDVCASLAQEHDAIIAALDMLFTGF